MRLESVIEKGVVIIFLVLKFLTVEMTFHFLCEVLSFFFLICEIMLADIGKCGIDMCHQNEFNILPLEGDP